MKRRNFVKAAGLGVAIPLAGSAMSPIPEEEGDKQVIELRTYDLRFGTNTKPLFSYLEDNLKPAMKLRGVEDFLMFNEFSQEEPKKLWVVITYKNAQTYLDCQSIIEDEVFLKASKDYHTSPAAKPMYNRFSSWVLNAFDGIPKLVQPIDGASLFELRIYEGYNEDAVRRKIKMFNQEEIDLFQRTALHSVFFGDMIAGPYRPALVYMLGFKDMEERTASWNKFVNHPDWKMMSAKEEYANTVSNIRKIFLTPV